MPRSIQVALWALLIAGVGTAAAQTSKPSSEWTEVDKLDFLLRRNVLRDFRIEGHTVTMVEGPKLHAVQPHTHWHTYCQWALLKARASAAGVEVGRILSAAGAELVVCR